MEVKRSRALAGACWLGLALMVGPVAQAAQPAPRLQIYGVKTTLEIAPVLLAATRHPAGADVRMGGIPSLFPEDPQPDFHEPGRADLATHAETQALRNSVAHPDLRIILTVSEGLYRIVARRSAGIRTVADLKGKRIGVIPRTSAAFYLHKMLATAGLDEGDVAVVVFSRDKVAWDQVDAVAHWEPESEAAFSAFGEDAVELYLPRVYRERYNLNTTAANLADPAMRRRIVDFVQSVILASCEIRADPSDAWATAASTAGRPLHEVARSWGRQVYPAYLPDDLLALMVEEEAWLARIDGRASRPRDQLSPLIDPTVLRDALAVLPGVPGPRC